MFYPFLYHREHRAHREIKLLKKGTIISQKNLDFQGSVIPAEAGIQLLQLFARSLGSGFPQNIFNARILRFFFA